ncbi:hypothetical protein [Bartonella sp. B1098]|nr:hypothetical protein [Bartonella sp. B1098]
MIRHNYGGGVIALLVIADCSVCSTVLMGYCYGWIVISGVI